MSLSPVFIVGSPRSGTSILTAALLRACYDGCYEGNFLSLIRTIELQVERHFRSFYSPNPKVLTARIDQAALKARLARVVVDTVAGLHTQGAWLDKTGGPEMIESIPVLRACFPTSRFILAKRRAIENLVSRLIKFPQFDFEYHCKDWVRTMQAWRALQATAPGTDTIEIDQRDISTQPHAVAERLGQFLDLAPGAVTLAERAFTSQRPQETKPGTADRILSLETTGWSPETMQIFHRICGPQMAQEGYTLDGTYRLQTSPPDRPFTTR